MSESPLDVVWLASYPKSGNTWLRFFLTCLMQGKPKSSLDVSKFIPEIGSQFEDEAYAKKGLTLMKTHLAFSDQLPLTANTRGFIYIVRHPLDVMLSNFNYHLSKLYEEFDAPLETYMVYNYIHPYTSNGGGDQHWIDLNYGTWHDNVHSWVTQGTERFPHLIIRYEDMLRTPLTIAEAINSFLHLNKTREEIEEALSFASFDNMKKLEETEIAQSKDSFFKREYNEVGYQKGFRFMNQGKANRKHTIPPHQRKLLMQLFSHYMAHFGYS